MGLTSSFHYFQNPSLDYKNIYILIVYAISLNYEVCIFWPLREFIEMNVCILESLGLTCSINIDQFLDAGQSNFVSNNSFI